MMMIETYGSMGVNTPPSDHSVTGYIDMMDIDGDGKISYEEYEIFILRQLKTRFEKDLYYNNIEVKRSQI